MSDSPSEPDYDYIVYIDESGETGLKNVLAGRAEKFKKLAERLGTDR